MKTALLLPGQGSHCVGMGKALRQACPSVRKPFQSTKERLNATLYKLPVLFIVNVDVFRIFQEETALPAAFVADHNLGECTALAAGGSLAYEEALLLVQRRATLIQASGVTRFIESGPGEVLKGFSRRIVSAVRCQGAETLDEVRALA